MNHRNPVSDAAFRSRPFWALDDNLQDGELEYQLEEFRRAGFGGVFLHARGDLRTPYLSREYMRQMRLCMEKARDLGLEAWIYDEYNWPSGTAGGVIEKLGREFCSKRLACREASGGARAPGEIFRETLDGRELVYRVEYGAGTDMLRRENTAAFLNLTHERYREACGDLFGETVPGTFFDEPQYAQYTEPGDTLPWTEELPEAYRRRWGCDLTPDLRSLFFDVGDYRAARVRFWYIVTDLFARNFTGQIFEWCGAHGLKSTGHLEWEETFTSQIRCVGDVMRHYEFMHIPGNDALGRGMFSPWIYRQTASVSAQLGKERTMTECFGNGGQNLSLHDKRWICSMLLSLGVDFFVPHISLYSLRGSNKRDCPPDNGYPQPWWKYSRLLEDSTARAAAAVAARRKKADLMILSPIVTAWSGYRPGWEGDADSLQDQYEYLNEMLLDGGLVYQVGDEMILEHHARAEGGKLVVGAMSYGAVLLPGAEELLPSTRALLSDFAAQGGRLCFIRTVPRGLETARAFLAATADDGVAWARKNARSDMDFSGGNAWVLEYEAEGGNGWLLSNPSRTRTAEVLARPADAAPAVYRLQTEAPGRVCVKSAGSPDFRFSIEPGGCAILEQAAAGTAEPPAPAPHGDFPVQGPWRLSPSLHGTQFRNCAALDFCRFRTQGQDWSAPAYVMDVYNALKAKQAAGVTAVERYNAAYEAEFSFLNRAGNCPAALCLETPGDFGITVNGRPLPFRDEGFFLDPSFRFCRIDGLLREGRNTILLSGLTNPCFSFEAVYLLGDFDVSLNAGRERVLDAPADFAESPDGLERKGYRFFAGELSLTGEAVLPEHFGGAFLTLREPEATVFRASLNGADCGVLWHAPWTLDVTAAARPGRNTVTLTAVNSLRNLLGPHHCLNGEFISASAEDYNNKSVWTDEVVTVPLGFSSCTLSVTD